MEKKYKILTGILVILFVCLVTWVIRTTPKAPPQHEKIEPPTTMEYENNVITEEKDGKKVWEITADKMVMDSVSQTAEIENIHGKFFKEDGKVMEITGDKGVYNQQTKDVHVEGNIVVLDGDGAKLMSENLDWTGAEELLTASNDVKIFREDVRAYGDSASSTDGFNHFFMKGNVRILKGVKDDDFAKELEEFKAKKAAEEAERIAKENAAEAEKNNATNSNEKNSKDTDKNQGE
ncbi:MAG: LPS export ABC transporter periplasmic protein LptC [Selenomonadaceae bacterium]|nr:LPS export ABC transporter periplasmic protein LptC [Selenomonadaceae bacterium]